MSSVFVSSLIWESFINYDCSCIYAYLYTYKDCIFIKTWIKSMQASAYVHSYWFYNDQYIIDVLISIISNYNGKWIKETFDGEGNLFFIEQSAKYVNLFIKKNLYTRKYIYLINVYNLLITYNALFLKN